MNTPTTDAEAFALADRLIADLRAQVAAAPAGLERSPYACVELTGSVLHIETGLREAGGNVPADVAAAARFLRMGVAYALEALRRGAEPVRTPEEDEARRRALLVEAIERARAATTDDDAPIEASDFVDVLVADLYARACRVSLTEVAPDLAGEHAALVAAVQAIRCKRRLDRLQVP